MEDIFMTLYIVTVIWIMDILYNLLFVCVSFCFFLIINIFYLIPQYLIALPVLFVFDEVSFCIMLCITNARLVRPCPFSQ